MIMLLLLLMSILFSASLIDIASAEQTSASHSALIKVIKFDDENNIDLAERYLLATALSTHPTEATLKHLLVSVSFLLINNNNN